MPVYVVLRFEGVSVFAMGAEVKVVGLALGEVVVEYGTCERRQQRRDDGERNDRANEVPDKCFVAHCSVVIIA